MSQDWLKIEKITIDKVEVAKMATALRMDRYAVLGRLLRIWSYFDSHSIDGSLAGVDTDFLDSLVSRKGFCAAMEAVGWLMVEVRSGDGQPQVGLMSVVTLPNYSRHNGKTAKDRALTGKRQQKRRNNGKTKEPLEESVTPVTNERDGERDKSNAPRNGQALRGASPEDTPTGEDTPTVEGEPPGGVEISSQELADRFDALYCGPTQLSKKQVEKFFSGLSAETRNNAAVMRAVCDETRGYTQTLLDFANWFKAKRKAPSNGKGPRPANRVEMGLETGGRP